MAALSSDIGSEHPASAKKIINNGTYFFIFITSSIINPAFQENNYKAVTKSRRKVSAAFALMGGQEKYFTGLL